MKNEVYWQIVKMYFKDRITIEDISQSTGVKFDLVENAIDQEIENIHEAKNITILKRKPTKESIYNEWKKNKHIVSSDMEQMFDLPRKELINRLHYITQQNVQNSFYYQIN